MFFHVHINPNSLLARVLIVFICPPVIGILLGHSLWERYQADQSLHWTRTTGVILSSERIDGLEPMGMREEPKIKYSYKVGKVDYDSDQICFGGGGVWGSRDFTVEKLRKYPRGQKIDAYYDPDEPSRACLEPGNVTGENLFFVIFFGVLFCLNLWMAAKYVRAWLFNEPVPRV